MASVRAAVGELEGVVKVEASLEKKKAVVTYVPTKVTTEQIKAAIEELGFGCELESEPDAES